MLTLFVVPLDGSPFGELALPVAARLAARHGAALHLVHAVPRLVRPLPVGGAPMYDSDFDEQRRAESAAYLERMAGRLAGDGARVTTAVLDGDDPAAAIATEAGARGASLLVMTTHGRGGVSRLWLGSVATGLLRASSLPLFVVRAVEDEAPPPPTELGHLLVPLDGSPEAEAALEPALALGAPFDARLTLLRVVRTADSMLPYDQTFWTAAEQGYVDAQRAEAEDYMLRVVERLRARGATVEGVVVLEPDPARCILGVAEERGCDAIAMATHARGAAARVLLGSVTDKVLRGTRLPLLAVRPPADAGAARSPAGTPAGAVPPPA